MWEGYDWTTTSAHHHYVSYLLLLLLLFPCCFCCFNFCCCYCCCCCFCCWFCCCFFCCFFCCASSAAVVSPAALVGCLYNSDTTASSGRSLQQHEFAQRKLKIAKQTFGVKWTNNTLLWHVLLGATGWQRRVRWFYKPAENAAWLLLLEIAWVSSGIGEAVARNVFSFLFCHSHTKARQQQT